MTASVITFRTSRFDPGSEPPNPINPIAGYSVLVWLRTSLSSLDFSEPDTEDWGWYSTVEFEGLSYLVGACCQGQPGDEPPLDWAIQIKKQRGLMDVLRGRNRMDRDDGLCALIHAALLAEPAFTNVELSAD